MTINEKEFEILKFRSMYTSAPSLPPYQLNDPNAYITPVGKWLRKLSIDELPQIVNVLRGEMSFVGPRPGAARNEELLRLERRKRGVFKVRPGITGWAQINGRDVLASNPEEKAKFDQYYVENVSLRSDLNILLETLKTVISRDGYVEGTIANPNDSRTKVLFVIHTLGGGGAERVLIDLLHSLDQERFDITLLTILDTGIYRSEVPTWVTYQTLVPVPKRLLRTATHSTSGTLQAKKSSLTRIAAVTYAALWRFAPVSLIRSLRVRGAFDVEVAFLEGIPARVVTGRSKLPAKKIGWVHTDFKTNHSSKQFFRKKEFEYETYKKLDAVVFVSEQARIGFEGTVGQLSNSVVLENPINLARIGSAASRVPDLKTVPGDGPLNICVVGRLEPVKGVRRLLEVKRRLEERDLSFRLTVVGDGSEYDALKQLSASAGDVELVGYQTNPYPFIQRADIFMIPSHTEGFSTVMIEALVLGTPVLSTEVSGSSFLPPDLVMDNSEHGIEAKIEAVLTDPAEREKIRESSSLVASSLAERNEEILSIIEKMITV